MMKKKVAEIVADFLVENGITKVFTVTGGGAMHLNDAFGHNPNLECIYNQHEQACSIGAEGYTRTGGKVAAVCVTSGPGGTNTITGVMGAWLDSIPMLVISGQMKYITTIESTSVPLRQLGFQEFNILDSVRCMTKYAVMVKNPESIKYHLERALYIAAKGRPGPVWLDIPLDVQGAYIDTTIEGNYNPREDNWLNAPKVTAGQVNDFIRKIKASKRPVILAGNGIRLSNSVDKFIKAAEKLNIPVATAWNAHDLIEDAHPLYAGRPGTIGTRGGNFVVQNSDLLISLGCRMNIRQISYEWKLFARKAFKIAIDIDEGELKKPTLSIDMPVHADLSDFLTRIMDADYEYNGQFDSWVSWCKEINQKYPPVIDRYYERTTPVNPYVFMKALSDQLKENDIVVASNGTACVCGFQTIAIKKGLRLFSNAGASSMGYGLPAAIGAAMTDRTRRVICLEGDGSIQMNLAELQTVTHHDLNMKIVWLNNDGYHSIRQTQYQNFEGEKKGYCGVDADSGLSLPDAEKIAYAFGIRFLRISGHDHIDERISEFLNDNHPVLCEVVLDKTQFFEPKTSSKVNEDGTISSPPLEDMYPFLDRDEFDSNMISERTV